MAASAFMQMSMQMKCDLCSFLENNKLSDIEAVQRDAEMKVSTYLSKFKVWNLLEMGKIGRDIASELYITRHIPPKRGRVENSEP